MSRESFDEVYINDGGSYGNRLTIIMITLVLLAVFWVPVGNYVEYTSEIRLMESHVIGLDGYESHEHRYDDVEGRNVFYVSLADGERFVYWYDKKTDDVVKSQVISQTL